MAQGVIGLILAIINKTLSFFTPESELLRLKKEERTLEDRLRKVYKRHNMDLFNQLYRRLKWVRQRIRDIERTR